MLEAIILAAGRGTRLRPYTEHTPKPLLAVQGKPILHWILQALPAEVSKLYVVVNYLAEQIEAWLAHQENLPSYQIVYQQQPLGSGDALLACKPLVSGSRFLVLNGDDLYSRADLASLLLYDFALLAYPVQHPHLFGILIMGQDGRLQELVEKPNWSGPQLANTGAYILPRSILEIQPTRSPRGEFELTEMVTKLARRQECRVVQARFWYPISTVEAWQEAQTLDLNSYATNSHTVS
ncbi:MAG: nucleotidyltransferase family protein [Gemmatales bacterium]|nr:nucleotidyltransferase family protein [Gemmatales bacterium]MDW7994630.1 nucleotidyltransferase family protein [Gemmatales bacterium]